MRRATRRSAISFNFSFTARDPHSAQRKLQAEYAPAAVKAVVELAFAGMPWSRASSAIREAAHAESAQASLTAQASSSRPKEFVGVFVEVWGHVDESGGKSEIQRFVVQPLFD